MHCKKPSSWILRRKTSNQYGTESRQNPDWIGNNSGGWRWMKRASTAISVSGMATSMVNDLNEATECMFVLNDLQTFDPIAPLLFHSALKTNYHLNTILKQNCSMGGCVNSVFLLIHRNSIDGLSYRIQGHSFLITYYWITKAPTVYLSCSAKASV